MKKNHILWVALLMTAALVMTACSNNDDNLTETPQAPSTSKIIPYTVTVNDGATTRATVDSDNKTLKFATGDKLYITGTNIKGVLDIQTGATTTSATFSGNLTYSGSGTPAADLTLTATLVSAQQSASLTTANKLVTVDDAGAVTVNYPTTAYCADVATAVQKYSRLTGTSRYDTKSFTLYQQTAFLNFVITFEDGTATSSSLSAVVNNNSSDICTANVTTTIENTKVVAKFVLPVAKGTVLNSAKVTMGSKTAISFGASQTLDGKVYNVKKIQSPSLNLTSPALGQVIGSDGKNYAANSVPGGVDKVAVIAYVNGSHGLALALQDAGQMTWTNANTAATNATPKFSNATWRVPTNDDWWRIFGQTGDVDTNSPQIISYDLPGYILGAGGSNLLEHYWSGSECNASNAWSLYIMSADDSSVAAYFMNTMPQDYVDVVYVRLCLAF